MLWFLRVFWRGSPGLAADAGMAVRGGASGVPIRALALALGQGSILSSMWWTTKTPLELTPTRRPRGSWEIWERERKTQPLEAGGGRPVTAVRRQAVFCPRPC